ncbi:MAG: YciE/YciF ferroxidase family protein [Solirubrobacteraceae bacterium]
MPDKDLNERDAKLVQWLSEAHAKEAELEADLSAHIALTDKPSYKKRLRQHLTETKEHKKRVAARIKKLGGTPITGPSLPGLPDAAGEIAGKAVAAVKGQLGSARAVVTSQPETHLRNAQEELREEHVEIAIYNRLDTLATEVGDRETAQLAKSIRRDEERMAKFLNAELKRLVKEVIRAEIPSAQRSKPRRSTTRSRSAASGTGRSSSSNGSGTARSRAAAARAASTASSSSRTASKRSSPSGASGATRRSRSTGK